jgi:uncharacterized protein YjbI with pentapeptide repeats
MGEGTRDAYVMRPRRRRAVRPTIRKPLRVQRSVGRRRLGHRLASIAAWPGWLTLAQLLTSIATVAALLFTAQSLRATHDQIGLTEQGQLTDRFSRAIEQLGSDKPDIRLGGIYALERLAWDSTRDHSTVMEVLTAFIRRSTPGPCPAEPQSLDATTQAALTVVGRRNATIDSRPLDVANTCLYRADLTRANLTNTNLTGADLTRANLTNTNLTGADLTRANLSSADLTNFYLVGVNLTNANLVGADLTRANLSSANLTNFSLIGVNLTNADLNNTDLIDADLTNANLTNANLADADLADANLTDADLTGAYLPKADLTGANLTNADLTGAYLTGVRGFP